MLGEIIDINKIIYATGMRYYSLFIGRQKSRDVTYF